MTSLLEDIAKGVKNPEPCVSQSECSVHVQKASSMWVRTPAIGFQNLKIWSDFSGWCWMKTFIVGVHLEFHEELEYIEALVSSLASEVKFNCSAANIIQTLTAEARAEQN
ncbi:hypothetical protein SADUNF_Sadunf12G0030200 [Salix dunnii]|uniref:Uncharacterized protein n=1 Tax=Salix dunnii TaxID=1413687 RepID=A0A835MVN7_9ROSI|nr:hypothetical protein SADUNF_Sadunf12G0030200 [Salix dunnii]